MGAEAEAEAIPLTAAAETAEEEEGLPASCDRDDT